MSQPGGPALLAGKTALITGATRGIGRGIVTGQSIVVDGGQTLPEIRQ